MLSKKCAYAPGPDVNRLNFLTSTRQLRHTAFNSFAVQAVSFDVVQHVKMTLPLHFYDVRYYAYVLYRIMFSRKR